MSEEQSPEGGATPPAGAEQQERQEQQQPETVEELQAKLEKYKGIASEQEKRAKSNAAAAKRLAELEDEKKTDAEKAADRISKADAEVAAIPSRVADALRAHLVDIHQIDKADAELFLTGTEPELLLKQVDRLVGQSGTRKKNHVPREGNPTPKPTETDERAFVRGLFGGGD